MQSGLPVPRCSCFHRSNPFLPQGKFIDFYYMSSSLSPTYMYRSEHFCLQSYHSSVWCRYFYRRTPESFLPSRFYESLQDWLIKKELQYHHWPRFASPVSGQTLVSCCGAESSLDPIPFSKEVSRCRVSWSLKGCGPFSPQQECLVTTHVSAATMAAKPCLPDHLIQILGKQYNNNIFKHLQGFLQSLWKPSPRVVSCVFISCVVLWCLFLEGRYYVLLPLPDTSTLVQAPATCLKPCRMRVDQWSGCHGDLCICILPVSRVPSCTLRYLLYPLFLLAR